MSEQKPREFYLVFAGEYPDTFLTIGDAQEYRVSVMANCGPPAA